ncbi:PREDICTED: uncharacterized protein LOC105152183 [Acromyrmex echinatior]|uniref:Uncharacterized protein n=1 Tax=Acromyrmex echinatior TaxID=103372 RepID=F4X356_ACREC|nr:PREDICTED: uncharacterized protein LOC105152183 [Acromyrmex echinatior]EGI59156.1 hypothetical protein G5I_12747 [Acromyrmex echinatior]
METQSSASSSNNDNENIESANKDGTATEKTKLRQEIKELRNIIKQHERNLQTRFKDIEDHVTKRSLQNFETFLTFSKLLNVKVALKNDLYRFAGFRCVKFRKNESVFNFTSTNEKQTDNTQAVQIFVQDGKAKLGKWIMPVSIDIKNILSKTPIDKLKKLTAFIKNCKHNVDCYTSRQEQFLSLKEHMSSIRHCTLQSDMGFKQISLELYGVHNSENNNYMNLIIHLLYHQDTARPYKVQIDTINGNKLNNDIKQRLKTYFKKFKMTDLQTAFDEILSEDNSIFTWMQEDDTESLLELNDTSSSDENFITQLQSERTSSLRKSRKKRELKKKWSKRIRQKTTENTTLPKDSLEDNQETNHLNAKKRRTKSPQQILIKKKKTEKTTSVLKQKKINKNPIEITPFHKSKVKLKQTKLNFQTQAATTSNANQISSSESKLGNKPDSERSKIPKLITSTPLHRKIRNIPLSPTLEINDITRIDTTKKIANRLNSLDLLDHSKDSDELGNKRTSEKKTPEKKNSEKKIPEKKSSEKKTPEKKSSEKKTPEKKTPEKVDRLLRSSMKPPKSSKVLKAYSMLTRSIKK